MKMNLDELKAGLDELLDKAKAILDERHSVDEVGSAEIVYDGDFLLTYYPEGGEVEEYYLEDIFEAED